MAEIETINGNPIVADIASESIVPVVDAWLTAHPEATTTVEDGAVTIRKLGRDSIDLIGSARETLLGMGDFQAYGLSTDGSFLTSQRYRVSNGEWMTFDHPIDIYVADGFKWGYIQNKDGATTWFGWFTAPVTIRAGLQFKLQIARVTEITSEVADVEEFVSALTVSSNASRGIERVIPESPKTFGAADMVSGNWTNGWLSNWNQRISTGRVYPVTAGNRFVYSFDSALNISFVHYNMDMTEHHFSNWLSSGGEYVFDVDGWFIIQVKKVSGATISPSEFSGDCTLYYGASEAHGERIAALEEAINVAPRPFSYYGAAIPSKLNTFSAERLLTMSYAGSSMTSQDIECFGDYLFVAFSGTEQIRIYSMTSTELLGYVEVETQHGTGMQFSNEYYDSGDEFPLLYVGGWTGNYINVLRISNDGGTWSATSVRRLLIPTTYGYYMAPSIDAEHSTLYAYGYKIMNNQQSGNSMKLVKADLGQLTDNGDGTYTPKILSDMEMPYLGVTQGRKYLGGSLYVGFSNTGSPYNARLVAIDATTGDVTADVPMSSVTSSENEGVCYRINGSEIEWYYSDYYNVYKVSF